MNCHFQLPIINFQLITLFQIIDDVSDLLFECGNIVYYNIPD